MATTRAPLSGADMRENRICDNRAPRQLSAPPPIHDVLPRYLIVCDIAVTYLQADIPTFRLVCKASLFVGRRNFDCALLYKNLKLLL